MATTISAAAFAAFLKVRYAAGDGYIMCATGQNPKKLSSWWFSGQYSGSQLNKALYWRDHAARVWDCNGLAEGYYKDLTGIDINTRARNNYSEWCAPKGSGTIPAAYRVPGAAVFKKSSYIHHVGYLIEPVTPGKPSGDWYIIEAKGVMYGVIRSKLSDGGWNCWGLMSKYFNYEAGASLDVNMTLGSRLLKSGASGADVKQLQEILLDCGLALPKYGTDGDYGAETTAAVRALQKLLRVGEDGEYGEETHAALMAYLEDNDTEDAGTDKPSQNVSIRVTAEVSAYVRLGAGTSYGIITAVRRGTVLESTGVADNGWRAVQVNGQMGWISPKMCEAA